MNVKAIIAYVNACIATVAAVLGESSTRKRPFAPMTTSISDEVKYITYL